MNIISNTPNHFSLTKGIIRDIITFVEVRYHLNAAVAQSVERRLGKAEVSGSSPVSSSFFMSTFGLWLYFIIFSLIFKEFFFIKEGHLHDTQMTFVYYVTKSLSVPYFPSGKLVKESFSTAGRPYFSFASTIALIINAMFLARFRMVCSPSRSFLTSSALKPCTWFQ